MFQMRLKFSGHANQAEQVRLNLRKHRRIVDGFSAREIVPSLHSGIIKDAVKGWEFFDDLAGSIPNRGEICDVKNELPHSGICGADAPQTISPTAADNDLIPQLMKRFGEPFPDA